MSFTIETMKWGCLYGFVKRQGPLDFSMTHRGGVNLNSEALAEGQAAALGGGLRAAGTALWRGYLLKEGLRSVFRAAPGKAATELDWWLAWACRSRIPQFVELSRKVRSKREGILRSVERGVSNARVEVTNNKIKVAIRQGYGFLNVDNLIALVMLRCSDLKPLLPGRGAA